MKYYTDELLNDKRTTGDQEADSFIKAMFSDSIEKNLLFTRLQALKHNHQLADLKNAYVNHLLFNKYELFPDWADNRQLTKGTAFFAKHAQAVMNMLGLLSLPYCYAGANGAMVLYLSDRMRGDVGKRLIETGEFVWDVMAPNAFEKDGNGFAAILKVRLIHAAARFYTLKNTNWNDAFGYPVNQEDMAGTNLSFSLIVIRGLRKFGFNVSYEDQQGFMHLWNVIGALLGVNRDLLPDDGKLAFELEEAIRTRQFTPSVQGKELTGSLINYFKSVNKDGQYSNSEISQVIRYLAGDQVADILDLPVAKLSPAKVQLLRTVNFLNDFKPLADSKAAYRKELNVFNKTRALLLQ